MQWSEIDRTHSAAKKSSRDELASNRESGLDILRRGYSKQPSPEEIRKRRTATIERRQ